MAPRCQVQAEPPDMFIELYSFSGPFRVAFVTGSDRCAGAGAANKACVCRAGTPACHHTLFITCFVLTSIHYEWKSIFHLDLIVSMLWQLKARRPRAPLGPPQPPRLSPPSTLLYFISNYRCLRRPGARLWGIIQARGTGRWYLCAGDLLGR